MLICCYYYLFFPETCSNIINVFHVKIYPFSFIPCSIFVFVNLLICLFMSVAISSFCFYDLLTQPYDSQKNINYIELETLNLMLSCGHDILYV